MITQTPGFKFPSENLAPENPGVSANKTPNHQYKLNPSQKHN